MTALIDTSAWIQFFRIRGNPAVKSWVDDLVSVGRAAYTCPVRYELFLGARPHELARLAEGLGHARRYVVTPLHWERAGMVAAGLRGRGLTFPPLDVIIAVVAEAEGVPLLSLDAHFSVIRRYALPSLNLLEGPPPRL